MLLVEAHGEVVGYLSASGDNHTSRYLKVDDIHDALKGELVEIQSVAEVVVGRYRLGIVVDHHRAIAFLAQRVECLHTTPVKLNR